MRARGGSLTVDRLWNDGNKGRRGLRSVFREFGRALVVSVDRHRLYARETVTHTPYVSVRWARERNDLLRV